MDIRWRGYSFPVLGRGDLHLLRRLDAMVMRSDGEGESESPSSTCWYFERAATADPHGLRAFVASAGLRNLSPEFLGDVELVDAVKHLIERGDLVGMYRGVSGGGKSKVTDSSTLQRQLVRKIEAAARGRLVHAGRTYQLAADVDLARVPERNRYEVVGHDDAKRVLESLASQPGTAPELAALLAQAGAHLSRDWRPPLQPDGLILLRRVVAPRIPTADPGPAMTPSQLRQLMEQATLEIEVVDLDDKPQEGLAFQIKAPDGNTAQGELDEKGRAQVKSSMPGIFVVTFPDLDGADWDGDGALELPPEEERSEASQHKVVQGERMATIATQYKFLRWQTLWDFADNSDLKDLRKNPNILFPDDEVAIPTKLKREAEVAGGKAKYVVASSCEVLRVCFDCASNNGEQPLSCIARPDTGGEDIEGTLSAEGWMEIPLPPNTSRVEVKLWKDDPETPLLIYDLAVGEMDPCSEVTGVQGRLANLGYYEGAIDGNTGPALAGAIAQFRREYGLSPGDEIDDDLVEALEGLHDNLAEPEKGEPHETTAEEAADQGEEDAGEGAEADDDDETSDEETSDGDEAEEQEGPEEEPESQEEDEEQLVEDWGDDDSGDDEDSEDDDNADDGEDGVADEDGGNGETGEDNEAGDAAKDSEDDEDDEDANPDDEGDGESQA